MEFELPKDFRELFELLNANDVKYLLIGGYAVGYYGYPRATNDIDVFVADDHANSRNLVKALSEFGFSGENLSEELFTQKKSIIEMGVEPMMIQIMNFASGISFDEAYARRVVVRIEGVDVSLISKDDLKTNKLASGRYKDLADIERLEMME